MIQGSLTLEDSYLLSTHATELLDHTNPTAIIVNLSETTNIDSAGLGGIISICDKAKHNKIPFALCCLNDQVLKEFKTRFPKNTTIPIFGTEEEAVANFTKYT